MRLSNSQIPIGFPSPTLTDPDMILPQDSSSSESSPSTPRKPQRLPSPPFITNGHGRSTSTPDERSRMKGTMYSPFRNGVLRRIEDPTRVRSSSENGVGRRGTEQSRYSYRPGDDVPPASSPSINDNQDGEEHRTLAEDDRQIQVAVETRDSTYSTPPIMEEDENDPHSHAAMTRRAEDILANAKKRLTDMESNLSRARSTLNTRPSSSMSSLANLSPEPVSLYTIPNKSGQLGSFSPSKHRQAVLPPLDENKQGHSRVFSETSVPSSLHTNLLNGHTVGKNGDVTVGNGTDVPFQERHSEPSRNWFWNGLTRNTSLNYAARQQNGLQPLNEDGPPLESFEQPSISQEDVFIDDETRDLSLDQLPQTTPSLKIQNNLTTGLSRARSTNQMSDLRDQMQDLKGKISTLKQKAREDNLRRRSLQSLRTPSPFTVAEQWHNGIPTAEKDPPLDESSEDDPTGHPMQKITTAPPDFEIDGGQKRRENEMKEIAVTPAIPEDNVLAERSEQTSFNEQHDSSETTIESDGPNGSEKASITISEDSPGAEVDDTEDSLYGDEDYHDTSATPIVQRHEDRPDAFDYEHFILNSAIGSYSGVGVRRSSSHRSRLSTSSVETTKPRQTKGEYSRDMPADDEALRNGGHGRQNSVDSVSTTATFTTADEVQGENDDTPRQSMAELRHSGQPDEQMINGGHFDVSKLKEARKLRSRKQIASAQKVVPNDATPKIMVKDEPIQQPDLLSYLSTLLPRDGETPVKILHIGEKDKEPVERLVKSLAKTCSHLDSLGPDSTQWEARVCRRNLDYARRVLDGEVNGETF